MNPLDPNDRNFYPSRLRGTNTPGYVEYDGKSGRQRKPFPDIGGVAARRFYVAQSQAGKNPRLVKS